MLLDCRNCCNGLIFLLFFCHEMALQWLISISLSVVWGEAFVSIHARE